MLNAESIEKYRSKATRYDQSAAFTMPLRVRTVDLLGLKPGDVVLDVGAGTGLSYPLLQQAVTPNGQVMAFEQSPEMFAHAEARRAALTGAPIWHVCASAEMVQLPMRADAILFNYVHDISRTPKAIANILRFAKPGARIAIAGMKFFPWWLAPLNVLAWAKNRPYNAKASDLWAPWDILQSHCTDWAQWSTHGGMGYIASARLKVQP